MIRLLAWLALSSPTPPEEDGSGMHDVSLLGPQPRALTDTWAPDGNFTIDLRDLLPADGAKARSPATSAAS